MKREAESILHLSTERPAAESRRRPYEPPRLVAFGDIRDKTLGGTPGMNDSTPPNTNIPGS